MKQAKIIIFIIAIAIIAGLFVWKFIKQTIPARQQIKQTMQRLPAPEQTATNRIQGQNDIAEGERSKQATENNKIENKVQVPKRFSGTGCYVKNADGSDSLYELSKNFNLDDPTSSITYTNQAKGILFEIPYNPNWGNKDCQVQPYTEFTQPSSGNILLEFGKPRAWITSEFHLTSSAHRTAEDIFKEQVGSTGSNPKKISIGQNQVVVYESLGMTTEIVYEAIGSKYNYSFSYIVGEKLNKDTVEELEKIIESVKFIDKAADETADWQTYRNDEIFIERGDETNNKVEKINLITKQITQASEVDNQNLSAFTGLPKEIQDKKISISNDVQIISNDESKLIVLSITSDKTAKPSELDGSLPVLSEVEYLCNNVTKNCIKSNIFSAANEKIVGSVLWFRWDSNASLLLGHLSGEGVGNAAPVYIYDIKNKILRETSGYNSLDEKQKRAEVPSGAFSPSLKQFVMIDNATRDAKLLLYQTDNIIKPFKL